MNTQISTTIGRAPVSDGSGKRDEVDGNAAGHGRMGGWFGYLPPDETRPRDGRGCRLVSTRAYMPTGQ